MTIDTGPMADARRMIIGHAPELADGNRTREPLTFLFHGVSLGELSVDAFFLLSGWLIARSMMRRADWAEFLTRRIVRIVPAFAVAYLVSVYAIAPVAGGDPIAAGPAVLVPLALLHAPPMLPGVFAALPHRDLNASMWTIAHEFRCYLLVMLLGVAGLLARRRAMVWLWAAVWLAFAASAMAGLQQPSAPILGSLAVRMLLDDPCQALRLSCAFLTGTLAYLYRDRLDNWMTGRMALACAAAAIAAMAASARIAEPILLLGGGLSLYWLAFHARLGRLADINRRWDISYGTYLYGWPSLNLLFLWMPGLSPWAAAPIALVASWTAGAASWWLIERPSSRLLAGRDGESGSAISPSTQEKGDPLSGRPFSQIRSRRSPALE